MEILNNILDKSDEYNTRIDSSDLLIRDVLVALVTFGSIKKAAEYLLMTDSKLEHIVRRKVKPLFIDKQSNEKWDNYILSKLDLRKCRKCCSIKSVLEFYENGLRSYCTTCEKARSLVYRHSNIEDARDRSKRHYIDNKPDYLARNKAREAYKKQALPAWSNIRAIRAFYNNCPNGFHVDHIYPLNSDWVCGLHVIENLQYLTAQENLVKGNRRITE